MTQRLPVPGSDDGDWGNILNGFLEVSHNADGSLITGALSAGGAALVSNNLSDLTSYATSRKNLDVPNAGESVDFYGADPTGATASDSAFAAAYAALGGDTGSGNILLGVGTYKLTNFECKSPNIGMRGPGSASCTIESYATGDTLRVHSASFNHTSAFSQTFKGGIWSGFTIDGTNAGASATGMHYGDIMYGQFNDIYIENFSGASAIGLWMDNVNGWTERMTWNGVQVVNCTKCIVFDVNSNTSSGSGFSSFGYNHFLSIQLAPLANQDGIVIRNGALVDGSVLNIMANCGQSTSGGNTGALIRITGSSTSAGGLSYSEMFGCTLNIAGETDWDGGSGTGHQTINVDSDYQNRFGATGSMYFINSWQSSNCGLGGSQATYLFSGYSYGDPNLSDGGSFSAFSVMGGSSRGIGVYPTGLGELYISTGDSFNFGQLYQNTTISLSDVPTQAREIWIKAQQPGTGGPYTITWPSQTIVKWPGGVVPTMSTTAWAIDLYILRTAGDGTWVGQAIQNCS